jgi:hypothetical protein
MSISGRLSHIWISTRDINIRKCSLSSNCRFGLLFQIKNNNLHILLCILLSGDVAINPDPCNVHLNRPIKCFAMNARSLMGTHKLTESETVCNLNCFQYLVYSEQIDIVCVNEKYDTWLNGDIDNSEILNSYYTILRNDRETRGGGVLLVINTDSFKSMRKVHQFQYLEIISAEITTSSNNRLLICSCYRPPNADQNWLNNFNHYLNYVCKCYENIIPVGD